MKYSSGPVESQRVFQCQSTTDPDISRLTSEWTNQGPYCFVFVYPRPCQMWWWRVPRERSITKMYQRGRTIEGWSIWRMYHRVLRTPRTRVSLSVHFRHNGILVKVVWSYQLRWCFRVSIPFQYIWGQELPPHRHKTFQTHWSLLRHRQKPFMLETRDTQQYIGLTKLCTFIFWFYDPFIVISSRLETFQTLQWNIK